MGVLTKTIHEPTDTNEGWFVAKAGFATTEGQRRAAFFGSDRTAVEARADGWMRQNDPIKCLSEIGV